MMRFFCERRDYGMYIALFCAEDRQNGTWIAKPLEFERHDPHTLNDAPMMRLEPEDAQRLADELWAAGIRPTQGKQSEGVTGAQAKHLDDMRTIAFHKLGIKGQSDGKP